MTSGDHPPYKRAFVWYKLVRVWAGLRFDDALHVRPADMVLGPHGLAFAIVSTKTTGPGKRVEVVHASFSPSAFIAESGWLECGFKVLASVARCIDRDYLLPLPDAGFQAARPVPAGYSDCASMSRALLLELNVPVAATAAGGARRWGASERRLLGPDAALFWTEHSDRSVLASWGACLGSATTL